MAKIHLFAKLVFSYFLVTIKCFYLETTIQLLNGCYFLPFVVFWAISNTTQIDHHVAF